jgi:D-alanyl-D-alanine carboxypeptidase (penicillin-binding protein 5/6)
MAVLTAVAPPIAGADPSQLAGASAPTGPAPAWLVADMVSGRMLGGRDAYGQYAPASTIKALLAMVVFDQLPMDAAATATSAQTDVECSCVGLVKAQQVGAVSTRAGSPSGLDGPGWESVSTPHDLAVIYRAALNYPMFAQILHQSTAAFPDGNGGFEQIASHDPLLTSYPGFIGGKTGYTNLAKETYVAVAQRNGKLLVAVMMYGSEELWDQGRALLDWGFSQT